MSLTPILVAGPGRSGTTALIVGGAKSTGYPGYPGTPASKNDIGSCGAAGENAFVSTLQEGRDRG